MASTGLAGMERRGLDYSKRSAIFIGRRFLVWEDAGFDRNNTKLLFYENSNTLLPSSAFLVYASGVCFRVSMAAGVGHVSAK